MLHVHHADRLEPLLDALADVLATAPGDPFTPDVVAVPAAGPRDAAMVGLGRRLGASAPGAGDGISANVEFLFPARFMARALGDTTRADDPEGDPWRLPRLTWAVLEQLAEGGIDVPGRADAEPWVLARRIADLFDRYATQRRRLVECWAAGTDSDGTFRDDGSPALLEAGHRWQAELWRAVRDRIAAPSPPERLPGLLEQIRQGTVQPQLPQRVAVFGVGAIAPTMQQLLVALGAQRDVHVFLRHPSMAAWSNSPHSLAGGLNLRANVDVTIAVSNPLLASWGRPALEARALLNGRDPADVEFVAHGAPPAAPRTLLEAVQHSVRTDARPAPTAVRADDGSFQVHACHGELRQLEALRDALGHAFVADPTLQPHDVLVLCPDLDRFAPLVEAVFARGPLPVPVRVGDRSLTTDEPIIDALHAVLTLVAGRATLSEVLALVQFPPVRRRFGWTIEDVEQIAEWSAELGARWGLTADHRAAWGMPTDVATGTWRTTVDQLLAGMALAAPTPRMVLGHTSPYDDLSTNDFRLVGTVADLLARLLDLHVAVQASRSIGAWIDLLHDVVDDFCAQDPDEPWRRQAVHRELTDILRAARTFQAGPDDGDATCAVPLTLAEVRAVVADSLAERPGRLPLRSGSVTVSSMVPQHGVPARVICLLGLDDGALRGGTFDGDDVLGLRPCVGERHPRHESRQLLLDAVLAAQERVIVTCNGADLTTNKAVPFVVPLVELLDAAGQMVELDRHLAPVVVRHPRHGFNERALLPGALLTGTGAPFTFDTSMLAAAHARRRGQAAIGEPTDSPWALPPSPLGTVDIDRLADVVANPSRHYLQRRLDVRVPEDPEALEDGLSVSVEPYVLGGLGRDLLATRRRGGAPAEWAAAARLHGSMPPGELSATTIAQVQDEVALLEVYAEQWGIPLTGTDELLLDQTLTVDLAGAPTPVVLQGKVLGVVARPGGYGVADMRFARPRPSFRLALALRMAAAQRQRPDADWSAVLLTRAKYGAKPTPLGMRLRGTGATRLANAERLLEMAVQLLEWANRDAVPLFDRASGALADNHVNGVFQGLAGDVRDRFVSLLWPEVSGEALLRDPLLRSDPAFLAPHEGLSRATAVATWMWGTFAATVEIVDQFGEPVEPAAPGGDRT